MKNMIQNFETIGTLGVMRGNGRKRISNKNAEEVVFSIVVRESVLNLLGQTLELHYVICLTPHLQCERF